MDFERTQRNFDHRLKMGREGQAFPKDKRLNMVAHSKELLANLLPFDTGEGVEAMRAILKAEKELEQISRPIACVNLLDEEVLDNLMTFTEEEFDRENYYGFIVLHDISFGLSQSLSCLTLAQDFLEGKTHDSFAKASSKVLTEKSLPVLEEVNLLLEYQREGQHCANLLIKDPSGIKLLEDFVERIKKPNSTYIQSLFWFSEVPEFIIAGAELALDYYRRVYPLSE